jgi:AsmA protein
MRALFIGLGVFIILILGTLFVVPSLVPSETYRTTIQQQLTQELGRDVVIAGDVSLSTFPLIKAKTGRATIANPDGFSRDALASLDGLEARIKLLPLFRKRVEIASFTLVKPDILLERLADGRVNWQIGIAPTQATTTTEPAGPFKRDGRFANVNPSLGAFRIEDGRLLFVDAVAKTRRELTDINIQLALPDMTETLGLEGTLQLDGDPLSLDVSLDSPRAFLDGRETRLIAKIETDGADLSLDGTLPPGTEIAFNGSVEGSLSDVALIKDFLSEPVPALDLLTRAALSAELSSEGGDGATQFSNLELTAEGDAFELTFTGAGQYDDALSLTGRYDLSATNIAALAKPFAPELTGLDAIGETRSTGTLALNGTDVSVTDMTATTKSAALTGRLIGAFQKRGDVVSGTGQFDVTVPDAGPFARRFVPDLTADADLAGAVTSTGTVAINGETIRVTDLVADTKSDVVTSRYNGALTITGDVIGADGAVSANIPSMAALNAATTTDIAYSDAIGSVSATGRVSGKTGNLSIDDIVADLRDGDINGQYKGRATVADAVSLAGDMSVTGKSLRKLAAQSGTVLPPSTDKGPVFETFGLSGAVSGPVDDLTLSQAKLALDDLSATGRFALSMQGTQPTLTGTLTLPGLDLRPYMAAYSAQRPEGVIQPWSETAIPTSGLRAIDADLSLSTPSIKLPRLSLGATQARAVLTNGVLTTTIPDMALYGGSGQATVVLDGRAAEPVIDITAGLNSLQAQSFLGAVAGFTQANGMGATEISLKGRGASQAAIMQSLTGGGNFSLKDGAISGIDAGEFLTGLQQALTARALPGGLGPSKTTQFKNLIGNFSMTDGVAKIDAFALNAAQVQVEGSGQIDLGNQTLDVRLRPKTVGEKASGLAAFGIPLRFSGPFGAAKPQLDQEFLGQVIQARAAAEAQDLITSQIGGTTGDVVGGVLGSILGNKKPALAVETPAPSNTEPESAPEPESEPEPKPKDETTEDKVENALRGLFGGKKDD